MCEICGGPCPASAGKPNVDQLPELVDLSNTGAGLLGGGTQPHGAADHPIPAAPNSPWTDPSTFISDGVGMDAEALAAVAAVAALEGSSAQGNGEAKETEAEAVRRVALWEGLRQLNNFKGDMLRSTLEGDGRSAGEEGYLGAVVCAVQRPWDTTHGTLTFNVNTDADGREMLSHGYAVVGGHVSAGSADKGGSVHGVAFVDHRADDANAGGKSPGAGVSWRVLGSSVQATRKVTGYFVLECPLLTEYFVLEYSY